MRNSRRRIPHSAFSTLQSLTDDGVDTDLDGLSDFIEARVGTDPVLADTDEDGLAGALEVRGFTFAGKTWYTNPVAMDSNDDGIADGLEWGQDTAGALRAAPLDTDGALARQGFAPADVALILLTHAHSDHAGSAAALRQSTGAPVAVHRGALAMLHRGDNGKVFPTDLEARISQRFVDKPFPALEPDIVLDDQSDLRALGVDAELLPTPGHSPGSISMLFENGDAIIGDILRGGILGGAFLAARPNYPFFLYDLADKRVILESVQRVLDAGAQRLYAGHGGPLPRPAVTQWLENRASKRGRRVSQNVGL